MCTRGSYDDKVEFPIMAYSNSKVAGLHAQNANTYGNEFRRRGDIYDGAYVNTYKNPYDHISTVYDDNYYWISEVDIFI
jgi:hypothetical protein